LKIKKQYLQKMKNVVASSSTTKHEQYCDYCKIKGHTKEKCWKVHPELFPKKWQKGKATTTIIQKNEPIIVDQVHGIIDQVHGHTVQNLNKRSYIDI
jgi:hypothetical protein